MCSGIAHKLCFSAGNRSIVRNIGFNNFSVSSVVEEEDSTFVEKLEEEDESRDLGYDLRSV